MMCKVKVWMKMKFVIIFILIYIIFFIFVISSGTTNSNHIEACESCFYIILTYFIHLQLSNKKLEFRKRVTPFSKSLLLSCNQAYGMMCWAFSRLRDSDGQEVTLHECNFPDNTDPVSGTRCTCSKLQPRAVEMHVSPIPCCSLPLQHLWNLLQPCCNSYNVWHCIKYLFY